MTRSEIRHQAAIAGTVTDSMTGKALSSANVWFYDAPAAFVDRLVTRARSVAIMARGLDLHQATLDDPAASTAQRLKAAQTILDVLATRRLLVGPRPDRTCTRSDGIYYFVDLPAGHYELAASLPAAGSRYGRGQAAADVIVNDETIELATSGIALPATALHGQVTVPDGKDPPGDESIFMATVHIQGSGERTFTDDTGSYTLTGLEPGQRTLAVASRGYQPVSTTVSLTQGVAQEINVDLMATASPPTRRLWLNADILTGLSAGDPVSHWPDQSHCHADLAQADTARQPTFRPGVANQHAVVRFDGVDDFLHHDLGTDQTWNGEFSLFAVVAAGHVNQRSGASLFASSQRFGGSRNRESFEICTNRASPRKYRLRTTVSYKFDDVTTDFVLLEAILSGTELTLYVNGQRERLVDLDANEGTQFEDYLLGVDRTGDIFFHGDIAEVLLYDDGLSAEDRMALEDYFCTRFNLPRP